MPFQVETTDMGKKRIGAYPRGKGRAQSYIKAGSSFWRSDWVVVH